MRKIKIFLAGLLASLILSLPLSAGAAGIDDGSNLAGLGSVRDAWSRSIYPGVTYSRIDSGNSAGNQVTHLVDFYPKDLGLRPVVSFGSYLYGGDTLGKMVEAYESRGYKVVYAINGDSFFGNGTPKGLIIKNGVVLSTGASYLTALGFDANNKPIYSNPKITSSATIGGVRVPLSQINTERGTDIAPAYILTESFAPTTKSTKKGVEVVVDITDENYQGLKIGQTVTGRVNKVYNVNDNSNGNTTPIGQDQVVLTASYLSPHASALNRAKPGQEVKISVASADQSNDWSTVKEAIGVFRPLREYGTNTSRASETDRHPRTTVALKNDGFMRIMENDGRMASSMGLSYKDLVDFLSIGSYPTILAFDGGGSSTLYTNMPGFPKAERLNVPSDGWERSVGSALLFVKDREEGGPVEALHLYANGKYKSEVTMDAGTSLAIDVRATDADYDPANFDRAEVVYTSDLGRGKVDKFVAGPKAGSGTITGTYPTGASGSLRVRVKNDLKSIGYEPGSISLKDGDKLSLAIKGFAPGRSYMLDPEAPTYQLSSPDLGTIDAKGNFTAGEFSSQGSIGVSFGDFSVNIPVEVKAERKLARLAGANRYETASLIGEKFGQAETVLLANSGNFPDALVAANLADSLASPILLTDGLGLSEETKGAIGKLGPARLILLGGENSISLGLEEDLRAQGYTVDRISGANRYETAVNLASQVQPKDYVYLASGENYPDALAISSLATKDQTPILLTAKDGLSPETRSYLEDKGITRLIIAGGLGTVSQKVTDDLEAMGLSVERIAGEDRYHTSALIGALAYPKENGYIISTGNNYIDALTAGPLAALTDRSIVLVKPDKLPESSAGLLKGAPFDKLILIGGENSITRPVSQAIGDLAQ